MSEAGLLKKFMLEYSKMGSRLFRANTGRGWTGQTAGPVKQTKRVTVHPGDVVLRRARPFHGMNKGTSDLLGWTSIKITPEMVGTTVAVFTAVEAKTEHVAPTREQKAFIQTLNDSGGIGVIARKLEDVLRTVSNFRGRGDQQDETRH